MKSRHLSTLALLAFAPLLAMAGEPVTDCVELGSSQEIVRAAGGDQIFLRDGQSHYRLGFARNCDAVMMTPTIQISADGQLDRLCPAGTKVRTKTSTCDVSVVETISPEEFAKRKQRARR